MVVVLTVGVGDWVGDPSPPSPSPAEGLDVGGGVPLPVPVWRWEAVRVHRGLPAASAEVGGSARPPRPPGGLSGGGWRRTSRHRGLPPASAEAAEFTAASRQPKRRRQAGLRRQPQEFAREEDPNLLENLCGRWEAAFERCPGCAEEG